MTINISLVPTTIEHVRELVHHLRQADRREAISLGLNPEQATFFSYKSGLWRRTAIINNQVAAIWGVGGTPMGLIGQPYLITSPVIEEISSIRFARLYRKEVEVMKTFFPILENYVDASYEGAVRMLKIAGFNLIGPTKVPPFNQEFYKFRMA